MENTEKMQLEDFIRIAEYGNNAWKGSFTKDEILRNAIDYFLEYEFSNKVGKATRIMQELCKLLVEDIEGGSEEAEGYLIKILHSSNWDMRVFYCRCCKKEEESVIFRNERKIKFFEKNQKRRR